MVLAVLVQYMELLLKSRIIKKIPIGPYGMSKLFCERILEDCAEKLNISFISLRYFNVIGNDNFPFAFDTSKNA